MLVNNIWCHVLLMASFLLAGSEVSTELFLRQYDLLANRFSFSLLPKDLWSKYCILLCLVYYSWFLKTFISLVGGNLSYVTVHMSQSIYQNSMGLRNNALLNILLVSVPLVTACKYNVRLLCPCWLFSSKYCILLLLDMLSLYVCF